MAFICPEFKIHQAPFWMSDTMMGTVGVRGEGRAQMMKMCSDPPPPRRSTPHPRGKGTHLSRSSSPMNQFSTDPTCFFCFSHAKPGHAGPEGGGPRRLPSPHAARLALPLPAAHGAQQRPELGAHRPHGAGLGDRERLR